MLSKITDISRSEIEKEGMLVLDSPSITTRAKRQPLLFQPATPKFESHTSLEDDIEEPVISKTPLNFTGYTFSPESIVLPVGEPSHGKANTRQSYKVESDLPQFNWPTVAGDEPAIRIIYDTDIKTVLSAEDLIARIEKRAERLKLTRTAETDENMPITIEIQSGSSRREV